MTSTLTHSTGMLVECTCSVYSKVTPTSPPLRFFYWVAMNEGVRRIDLSIIEGADSSTDLLSLSHVFHNDTSITTFTVDLADSQYFIRTNTAIIRNNLAGGSEVVILNVNTPTIPSIISYGGTPIVYAPAAPAGVILSYPDGQLQALARDNITALEMFRSMRQPLPCELCTYLCSMYMCMYKEREEREVGRIESKKKREQRRNGD